MVWRSGGFVPVSYAPDFEPRVTGADEGRDTEEELDMDGLVGLTEEMGVTTAEEEDLSWVDD